VTTEGLDEAWHSYFGSNAGIERSFPPSPANTSACQGKRHATGLAADILTNR